MAKALLPTAGDDGGPEKMQRTKGMTADRSCSQSMTGRTYGVRAAIFVAKKP